MAKLSDRALIDLGRLAGERSVAVVDDVLQLIDDDTQAYTVMLSVAANLAINAAHLMQAGMTVQNGKQPDIADCTYQVMKNMADLLGLQTKLVTKGGKSCKT